MQEINIYMSHKHIVVEFSLDVLKFIAESLRIFWSMAFYFLALSQVDSKK